MPGLRRLRPNLEKFRLLETVTLADRTSDATVLVVLQQQVTVCSANAYM